MWVKLHLAHHLLLLTILQLYRLHHLPTPLPSPGSNSSCLFIGCQAPICQLLYFSRCCCCCSVAKLCLSLCDLVDHSGQAPLSFTISWSWLKLLFIESVMPSNHLILCCPLLLLPSIFPSIRIFFNESAVCIKWPAYWSFSFSYQFFQWIFRVDLLSDWLVWYPFSPRDSLEFSLASKFESINSSALSLLYSPTLTSIHDYWKNHSFD